MSELTRFYTALAIILFREKKKKNELKSIELEVNF